MQTYLNMEINEQGNLEITATPEGIEYLQDQTEGNELYRRINNITNITWKNSNPTMWVDLLESYSCNGSYHLCNNNTFALTSAPFIADIPMGTLDNDPEKEVYYPETKFWYFNEYAVIDELEKLLKGETITWLAVPEDNEAIKNERRIVLCKMYQDNDFTKYTAIEIELELDRREREKPKPLTTLQQLEFIKNNDPEEEKYDIEKLFKKSYDHAMKKVLPYMYFSNGHPTILSKFELDYTKSLEHNAQVYESKVKELGIDIENFIPFCSHYTLFLHDYFRKRDNNKDQYSNAHTHRLIHLIQYLVSSSIANDYKETNEFTDLHKIEYNQSQYEYTIGNISVKGFANGRTDIKGLTEEQNKILSNMFDIAIRLRNK